MIKQKFTKIQLNLIINKNFSIIHNFHSPYILWYNGKQETYDDNINEYNKYIQAFLTKRFTNKKEIAPKIKVIKDLNKVLNPYHNDFYIQIPYPCHNLLDYTYMKYMQDLRILDSGYIISRFFEENEKPMYDAYLSKVLISGRVEFIEDLEYFTKIKSECDKLIQIFYNGDKLSPFEREIERAYLTLKQNKYYKLMNLYRSNPKLKREECHLTFSERNKINGHVNFRMKHPMYFFNPCPIFEKINVETIFNSLYEMRYNNYNKFQFLKKLKLKFQYRKSLLKTSHRVEFASYYIYLQIYQYLESFEFNNEFNLNLNFKINFNLLVFHNWLIIQRLQKLSNNNNKKFCNYIIEILIDKLILYFNQNLDKFQTIHKDIPQIVNIKTFIYKLFDLFTWHFEILHKENNLENLRGFLKDIIFDNTKTIDDKSLIKFSYYSFIHYEYLNTKSYNDIESSDFNFSVNRIPIQINQFIYNKDKLSETENNLYDNINLDKIIQNFKENKSFLFVKLKNKNFENNLKQFEYLKNNIGMNPYKDKYNFVTIDLSKGILGKFDNFIQNDFDVEKAMAIEKVINLN